MATLTASYTASQRESFVLKTEDDVYGYAQKYQWDHAVRIVGFHIDLREVDVGGETFDVKCTLRLSRQGAAAATSSDVYDETDTFVPSMSFGFDYDLAASTDIWVAIHTDGTLISNIHYLTIDAANSGDIPTVFQSKADSIDNATLDSWTLMTGANDYFGSLEAHTDYPGSSITDDIRSISIRSGMNDVSGSMTGATCDLVLDDHDGDYTVPDPANSFWKLNARVKVVATYDSVDYPLFFGTIDEVVPDLTIGAKRSVQVHCNSWFDQFSAQRVTIGAGSTAQDIVANMGLFNDSEADVADVTDEITVTNEAALAALSRIVKNGVHYHYVDGSGVYTMKPYSWLDAAGVENYAEKTPDSVIVEFNKNDLFNYIIVTNGAGSVVAAAGTSVGNYGIRMLEISDTDIADGDRATIAARYALAKRNQVNLPTFEFNNLYPDVFEIDFGTVIQYTNSRLSWTNKKFIVVQIERSITPPSDHVITLVTREWFDMTP